MTRLTVDGLAYALTDEQIADLIRAARRTVGAWDPDRALDGATMDNAIGSLVDALDQCEVRQPEPVRCRACHGTGLRGLIVASAGRYLDDPCGACGGSGRVPCPHPESLPWDIDPTCARCGEMPSV